MSEDPNTPTPDQGAEFWKGEAKKAFTERDSIKAKLKDLEGRVLSDDDRKLFDKLKGDAATAEDERKRKAGEFDQWRSDITKKHADEMAKANERATKAEDALKQTRIGYQFAAATTLFGEAGKTVLTPAIAQAYFGKFVSVEDDGTITVQGQDGHTILDAKTGKPAAFADALAELIESLPDKKSILRGSGKTGSGSSGGARDGHDPFDGVDFSNLTPQQRTDPKILAELKRRQPAGAMVFGRAYSN
jgi:hypothetical protein